MKTRTIIFSCMGICILLIIMFFIAKLNVKNKSPIKIGFAKTLSGVYSPAGNHTRSGAMLAVEQVNRSGGINRRMIELIVVDDQADPEIALKVDRQLIDSGVVAILGHFLSGLVIETIPLMNEKNIVMIASPGTSRLSGLYDNLIRLSSPADKRAPYIADLPFTKLNIRKMAVVYDISNLKFTLTLSNRLKKEFEKLGGEVVSLVPFDPREEYSPGDVAKSIIDTKAAGLFLITNSIHGALICQHLRKAGSDVKIVASEWAYHDKAFIQNGGKAVEGVYSIGTYNGESKSKSFLEFKRDYKNRFGDEPGSVDLRGYEATNVLIEALGLTIDPSKLKETMLTHKVFQGIDTKIIIDKFGDADRTLYVYKIRNGKITVIDSIEPVIN